VRPCALHYEARGPQDAQTVILIGSIGTDLSIWSAQVAALAGRFRVVACDVRGHGGSPVPPGPYSIAELGDDLVALLDRLALERATLCGLSIGAMISLWVAAHDPERVERLIACCTTARFGPETRAAYRERAGVVRARGMGAVVDAVVARWFTPEFAAHRPEAVRAVREGFLATPAEGYAGCCEALAELDLRSDLGRVEAPTLVLSGDRDPATPPDQGRAIADAIPGASFDLVAEAAHLASVERAELLTALILRFLTPETAMTKEADR
jgi:3-oxoadipate enol-lactonase